MVTYRKTAFAAVILTLTVAACDPASTPPVFEGPGPQTASLQQRSALNHLGSVTIAHGSDVRFVATYPPTADPVDLARRAITIDGTLFIDGRLSIDAAIVLNTRKIVLGPGAFWSPAARPPAPNS